MGEDRSCGERKALITFIHESEHSQKFRAPIAIDMRLLYYAKQERLTINGLCNQGVGTTARLRSSLAAISEQNSTSLAYE
jgi:hypothetical protein